MPGRPSSSLSTWRPSVVGPKARLVHRPRPIRPNHEPSRSRRGPEDGTVEADLHIDVLPLWAFGDSDADCGCVCMKRSHSAASAVGRGRRYYSATVSPARPTRRRAGRIDKRISELCAINAHGDGSAIVIAAVQATYAATTDASLLLWLGMGIPPAYGAT